MNHPDAPATPIAWNGLRLTVPPDWRPTRLGLGYLLFEDGAGPAFELKWRPKAGRDGMEAAFRAMTPKGRARRAEALPGSWQRALGDFESMPMAWNTADHAGLGAALYCPECGLAAVFQGYGGKQGLSSERETEIAAVLSSLRHHDARPPAFAVFGLAYTPPSGFVLASFHFAPGRFSLRFASGRRSLDILRLAPAEVLLARDGLARLAAQGFGFDPGIAATEGSMGTAPAVWLAERQGMAWGQRLARLCGRPARLAVLRHDQAADKLLGAAASAPTPIDPAWLAETAGHCVSL